MPDRAAVKAALQCAQAVRCNAQREFVSFESTEAAETITKAYRKFADAVYPLVRFIEALEDKPMRGIDDILYSIHGGREQLDGEEIRHSELVALRDAYMEAIGRV